MPQKLTLQYKTTVALLSAKISDCVYFDCKSRYVAKLQLAQETLARIQAEIDDIQNAIRTKLTPVDKLTVSDKSTVAEIAARYEALSDYDKTCVDAEDILQLNKALVRVESLTTAVNVGIALSVVAVALVAFVVWRIVLRKRRSVANKMPESEE